MHSAIELLTPAACMDLTVLDTAKAELGIAPTDTSQDDRIGALIKQASGIVSDYCDTVFGAEEVRETFWADWPGEYQRSYLLSREPIISIASVVIDGQTLDSSMYRVDRGNFLHRLNAIGVCHWTWNQTAVIDYTAGYVLLDDLPYGVERATLNLLKGFNSAIARDPTVRSEDIPGVRSVTYSVGGSTTLFGGGSLPPDVVALLEPHRRLSFA